MLRDAWFLALEDVKHLLRDRETAVWAFVMPVVFFYFIGTVTSGFGGRGRAGGEPLLVVEPEGGGGVLADELRRRLEERGFAVERAAPDAELAGARRRIELPEGFTEGALAGEPQTVRFHRRGAGPATEYEKVRVARALYTVLADLVVLDDEGRAPLPDAFEELAARPRALVVAARPAGQRREIPTGFEQAIPGMVVMFTMSILLSAGAVLLVVERRSGLLRRLAATPISRGSLVLGKWGGKLALGLVQLAFGLLAGTLLFRMEWGPSFAAVLGILLLWTALNASLAVWLGNLARSEAQASAAGTLAALVLAALGGCWWPIEVSPPWMQSLALALPTGWTMDALHRLVSFEEAPVEVLPHALALAAAALVVGWAAARTFRYA